MNTTTIMPPESPCCSEAVRSDVLTCLRRQPRMPLSIDELVGSLAGVSASQVESALQELEGRVPGPEGPGSAYVHRCRCSDLSVYIP